MARGGGLRHAVPPWVRLLTADAMEVTRSAGRFDLIFADAQGGKWEGLDATVAALRPGVPAVVPGVARALVVLRRIAMRGNTIASPAVCASRARVVAAVAPVSA